MSLYNGYGGVGARFTTDEKDEAILRKLANGMVSKFDGEPMFIREALVTTYKSKESRLEKVAYKWEPTLTESEVSVCIS